MSPSPGHNNLAFIKVTELFLFACNWDIEDIKMKYLRPAYMLIYLWPWYAQLFFKQ